MCKKYLRDVNLIQYTASVKVSSHSYVRSSVVKVTPLISKIVQAVAENSENKNFSCTYTPLLHNVQAVGTVTEWGPSFSVSLQLSFYLPSAVSVGSHEAHIVSSQFCRLPSALL